MKKQYITPVLDVVSFVPTEIIVTSPPGIGGPSDGSPQYSRHRDPIWDEDE